MLVSPVTLVISKVAFLVALFDSKAWKTSRMLKSVPVTRLGNLIRTA